MPSLKLSGYALLLILILPACNATDSVNHYEDTDSATGPRIDKEHMQAPPDTTEIPVKKGRDSASIRVSPPGETDTTQLNIQ